MGFDGSAEISVTVDPAPRGVPLAETTPALRSVESRLAILSGTMGTEADSVG